MKKILGILVLGLLLSACSKEKEVKTLSCEFKNAYDGSVRMNSNHEFYSSISGDKTITLDYKRELLNDLDTPVWNDNKIVGVLHRNIQGEFKIDTTLTLNRNTGGLKKEITTKHGTTTINYKCSKASKKF